MGESLQQQSASVLIDERIQQLADWRGSLLAKLRALIHEADPEIVEEWKWRGVPVFSDHGIICTGETYKSAVKLTFAQGAALADPAALFNASLDGNVRRAIDFHDGDQVNEPAFLKLLRDAVAFNQGPCGNEALIVCVWVDAALTEVIERSAH